MCQMCLQDFHTAIAGAMSDDEYTRELYSAMLEDAQKDLLAGMERAAQRCVKKAELKVHPHHQNYVRTLEKFASLWTSP